MRIIAVLIALMTMPVFAQSPTYPVRVIRFIVPVPPGVDPVLSTPEIFTAFLKSEFSRWGKVISAAGIRAD